MAELEHAAGGAKGGRERFAERLRTSARERPADGVCRRAEDEPEGGGAGRFQRQKGVGREAGEERARSGGLEGARRETAGGLDGVQSEAREQ